MNRTVAGSRVSFWDSLDTETYSPVRDMTVARAPRDDVREFCRRWHYAAREGNAAWNYGIYDGLTLVGIASFNNGTKDAVRAVFGVEHAVWVAHLGRLVCAEEAPTNTESRLLAGALRLFHGDCPVIRAVLTYAAPSQGHIGIIYQATNALYLGMTSANHHYLDQAGGRRSQQQDGNISMQKARTRGWTVHHEPGKHRYLYLLGTKTERREALRLLKYPILPYPKAKP